MKPSARERHLARVLKARQTHADYLAAIEARKQAEKKARKDKEDGEREMVRLRHWEETRKEREQSQARQRELWEAERARRLEEQFERHCQTAEDTRLMYEAESFAASVVGLTVSEYRELQVARGQLLQVLVRYGRLAARNEQLQNPRRVGGFGGLYRLAFIMAALGGGSYDPR